MTDTSNKGDRKMYPLLYVRKRMPPPQQLSSGRVDTSDPVSDGILETLDSVGLAISSVVSSGAHDTTSTLGLLSSGYTC